MRKKIILAIIFALFFNPSFAIDDNKPLNLKDCINLAIQNSPLIKKQKINYKRAKNDVSIAKSIYFPTISGGTGYDFRDRESKEIKGVTSHDFDAYAGFRQLLWDFGKTLANVKMEKFYKTVAMYDFETSILDTIYDVKLKYYTVLANKAGVEIDKENLLINERNYQRTNAYFTEGLRSKIDLVNAEVYVTQAKVSLIGIEDSYKTSLSELNNSMYMADNPKYDIEVPENFKLIKDVTPKSLTDFTRPIEDFLSAPKDLENAKLIGAVDTTDYSSLYKFEKFPYTFEECVKIAREKRPDIKALNSTYDAVKEYVKYVKREYLPELTTSGSYNYNKQKYYGDTSSLHSFSVGVDLTASINIAQEKFKIDNAKLQLELAQNDIDKLYQDVYFDVQNAYIAMMKFEEQIPLLEQKIHQTLENLELADGRYNVGLGDYIELQDAKVNYNLAQHAFIQAVFNYNVAKAKLEYEMGLNNDVNEKLEG